MLSPEQGKKLLELARDSINSELDNDKIDLSLYKEFSEKRGVFVTLHLSGELRGCIGFPYDNHPLYEAVHEAAKSSAFDDPRFSPLSTEELEKIKFEVSVLTQPELIVVKDYTEYPEKIKIGEDGLIIKSMFNSGLLLPQVPEEYGWEVEEFLEHLCLKAGLSKDSWMNLDNKIYEFQAQIFSE